MALTAGLRCAAKNVAAVVGTSTWHISGDSYRRRWPTALPRPVSLHHGDADEVVRTSRGVASKERLDELGFRVSFDTCGHGPRLPRGVRRDLIRFCPGCRPPGQRSLLRLAFHEVPKSASEGDLEALMARLRNLAAVA